MLIVGSRSEFLREFRAAINWLAIPNDPPIQNRERPPVQGSKEGGPGMLRGSSEIVVDGDAGPTGWRIILAPRLMPFAAVSLRLAIQQVPITATVLASLSPALG
jgi:hypothetical protein